MKRILRSFLTLLMLVVWVSGFAADKTYSYTFKSGGSFTADKQTKTLGGVNWTIASDGYLSFEGNNKAQQIGKKNSPAKNTEISTSDFSGTIKSVKINGWNAKAAKANVEVFVGNVSYGTKNFTTDKTSEYLFNGTSSGALKIKITNNVASSDAVAYFIKTISVTYEEGPAKAATTLTFTNPTINIEEGNEATFIGQTATLKAGETVLNNAVTYTTNNNAMFEAYEANVGPKVLKAGAYGTAVVTATFAGDDTYAASTATYTVNYTEKAKPATTLDFGFATKTVNINESFTATATLKAGEATISGNVTYTSSKSEVATVNVTTGEVSALTAGTTRITANFAGNDNYAASTATYELTVVDPNAAEVTFDFSKPGKYGYDDPATNNETVIGVGNSIVSGIVSLTVTKESESSNAKSRFWNSRGEITYRLYKGAINTVSVPQGYVITAISITDNNNGKSKLVTIGENKDNSDWTGSAQSVQITATGSAVLETMTVAYSKLPSIDLDESQNNAETISGNAAKTVNVKLTRTLKADVWNTFCVPFDVTVAGSPLEGATIKQIASVTEKDDGAVINFENAPATLEAGKAYLVRTATAIVNPTFNGVTVKNVDPTNCSGNEKYQLIGIYSPLNIDASLYGKVFGINNQDKLAKVKENTSIKGMRAYFLLANSATAAKLNFGGELTGIDAVDNGEAVMTGKVYNLNGQYVGNSLEGLKKGVYVVNGKKVLK